MMKFYEGEDDEIYEGKEEEIHEVDYQPLRITCLI